MNINGPVNIIRLEGYINNVKKILYIYSDWHLEPYAQTNCNVNGAVDIDLFLDTSFSNVDHTVDFFFEVNLKNIQKYNRKFKSRYIDNVAQLFSRNFNININNKVKTSSKYNNVRLHYIDIRDDKYILKEYLDKIHSLYFNRIYYSDYIININDNESFLNFWVEELDKLDLLSEDLLHYINSYSYVNKIINKINNKYVKEILNKYLNLFYTNLKNTKNITQQVYNKILNITKIYSKMKDVKHIDKIPTLIHKINYFLEYTYINIQIILLMDLYFLRRFLDKLYIRTGVLYCGARHTINIIYILINEFDFKITHCTSDINKIYSIVKKKNYKNTIYYGIQTLTNNNKIIQCSDISSFPKKIFS
jgi:hypothetical protein